MDLRHDVTDITEVFHKNDRLVVPKYQRGYSWDKTNFLELWDDLKDRLLSGDDHHFFGTIILSERKEESNSFDIIDGQQRAITFTILFRVMHDLCSDSNGLKQQIYKKVFQKKDKGGYKLEVSEADGAFFREYIQQKDPTRKKTGKRISEKRIRECYHFFEDKITEYAREEGCKIDDVVNILFDKLESDTHLLLLKVASDVDAYTIFESINAKRVDLAPAELLKNYVFSVADNSSEASMLNEAQTKWQVIIDNFEEFDTRPEITDYIRTYWLSAYGHVGQKELYKTLKQHLKRDTNKVIDFLNGLSTESSFYAALLNSKDSGMINEISLKSLMPLNDLSLKQANPVFLSLLSQGANQKEFDLLTERITSLFIRRSIIGSNPNEIEKLFSSAARQIRANYEKGIDELKSKIDSLMPDDDAVFHEITTASRTPNTRYLLSEYELSLSARGGKKIDKPTLEHIMPQMPEKYSDWGLDDQVLHDRWVNNIGNLTLLEKPINSSVKNKNYSVKRAEYLKKHTDMNMTKALCKNFNTWNKEQIKTRASEIARFVTNRWPR